MKTIKTFLLAGMTAILLTTLTSCTDYQDEIDALDVRVTYLEKLVKEVNTDIASLKTIVDALKDNDYITDAYQNEEGDWVITFNKRKAIVIHNGHDAPKPNITVEQDSDGNFYWKIDGNWLTTDGTPNGPRIRVNGINGTSPKVKIINGYWYISADGSDDFQPLLDEHNNPVPATGNNASNYIQIDTTHWSDGYVEFIIPGLGRVNVPVGKP